MIIPKILSLFLSLTLIMPLHGAWRRVASIVQRHPIAVTAAVGAAVGVAYKYPEYARVQREHRELDEALRHLDKAMKRRHREAVHQVAEYVPQRNASQDELTRALILGIQVSNVAKVEEFLRAGAKINRLDQKGRLPLDVAATGGNTALVAALLKAGAGVNMRDGLGCMPLCTASIAGHAAVVDQLLKAGAFVNAVDGYGNNALFLAVIFEHTAVADTLLAAGANPSQKNNIGMTPRDAAEEADDGGAMLALFEKHNGPAVAAPLPAAPERAVSV